MPDRAWRYPARSESPHTSSAFSGIEEHRLPALGDLGGELDVLRAQRGDRDRNAFADRMIDQLQRLAQTGAPVGGQRNLVVLAVIGHPFAAPHLPADLDDLAGAAQRRVERHAVEALHHLRSRRADAQPEAAVGDVVQPGGRHRQQRRGADVDRDHAGAQLDPGRLGRQEAELADRVVRVGLGDQRDVDADLLQLDDLVDGL